MLDQLYGNSLAYTVASGHLRDAEVSGATLAHAQRAVQATLDAFSWHGPPRTVPWSLPATTKAAAEAAP